MGNYDEMFMRDVRRELEKARGKFPGNEHQAAAMTEEAGEVIKALLEHTHEGGDPVEVYKECVQTAAMALRVAVEGDHSFAYDLAAIVAGREDEVPDGSRVERLVETRGIEQVAMVREADLAGLEAAYLRQSDTVHEIKAERDQYRDQADDYWGVILILSEDLGVPYEPHQSFKERLEEAIKEFWKNRDVIEEVTYLLEQSAGPFDRACALLRGDPSPASLDGKGGEETVAQAEDSEHDPSYVTIPYWAAHIAVQGLQNSSHPLDLGVARLIHEALEDETHDG